MAAESYAHDRLTGQAAQGYVARVREYYDATVESYLEHVGRTFQTGLLADTGSRDPAPATNEYLARQAGVRPGDRILDAGCGVCGPAIDIAHAFPDVAIESVTLSTAQAATGRALVASAGLSDRIHVYVADFHALPFADGAFDVALFLESIAYAYELPRLLAGVRRALRPGGTVLFKDPFIAERELTDAERARLAAGASRYEARPVRASELANLLGPAGFVDADRRDLGGIVDRSRFAAAFFEQRSDFPFPILTPFGRRHFVDLDQPPTQHAVVTARRPGRRAPGATRGRSGRLRDPTRGR